MMFRMQAISPLAMVLAIAMTASADFPPEWDRKQSEEHGWIYDDFDAGVAKANESGKPLLVVLRCPP